VPTNAKKYSVPLFPDTVVAKEAYPLDKTVGVVEETPDLTHQEVAETSSRGRGCASRSLAEGQSDSEMGFAHSHWDEYLSPLEASRWRSHNRRSLSYHSDFEDWPDSYVTEESDSENGTGQSTANKPAYEDREQRLGEHRGYDKEKGISMDRYTIPSGELRKLGSQTPASPPTAAKSEILENLAAKPSSGTPMFVPGSSARLLGFIGLSADSGSKGNAKDPLFNKHSLEYHLACLKRHTCTKRVGWVEATDAEKQNALDEGRTPPEFICPKRFEHIMESEEYKRCHLCRFTTLEMRLLLQKEPHHPKAHICGLRSEHILESDGWKNCQICRTQIRGMSAEYLAPRGVTV
jgi:hypothetical protein